MACNGPAYFQLSFKTPSERVPESDGGRTKNEKNTVEKRAWKIVQEKVEEDQEVLDFFNSYSWTLGDLLWYIFAIVIQPV